MTDTPANQPAESRTGFASLGTDYTPPSVEEVQALLPRGEVIEFIGHGGMGTYYRARQPRLDRLAAIKVLLADPEEDASLIERFKKEASAMARLNHCNIIKVYDYGEKDSTLYLIMEHVEGKPLDQVLQTRGFGLRDIAAILLQVCDALEYAHGNDVVHHDLRLGNTLLDSEGIVKVGDFGMARLIGEELFCRNLAGDNEAMGTMEYVAPEQHMEGTEVDGRADIYSMGVMLYKLATRTFPKDGFVVPSHFAPDINPLVDKIVINCMQADPEKRYQSIGQIREMLYKLIPQG